MTDEQIRDAIEQMKVHCDLKMKDYESVSARSVLYELGYDADKADKVIKVIAAAGFDYCLDATIPCSSGVLDTPPQRPSSSVCYWGPDQLKSRLFAIDWRLDKALKEVRS